MGRMRRIIAWMMAAGIVAGALSGCGEQKHTTQILGYFDTVVTLSAQGISAGDFDRLTDFLTQKLAHYHALFDAFDSYDGLSNLKTVNDSAGQAVSVDPELLELLTLSADLYRKTEGRFNIYMGRVTARYREFLSSDTLPPPDPEELRPLMEGADPSALVIDSAAGTVTLREGILLDLGGIAKGFAADRISTAAKEAGFDCFLLNFGGSVTAVGEKAPQTPFRVGIAHPRSQTGEVLRTLSLADGHLVTSGDYQRYRMVEGVRYHHIIDPETLLPATYFPSITLCSTSAAVADAFSTALFCTDVSTGDRLVAQCPEITQVIRITYEEVA